MSNGKHKLWVEKYRPQTLDEYIFHDEQQERIFRQMVEDESIPHLLLSGVQGTGKTTLAQVLINELEIEPSDVLTLNASDENSVDVMRDKIKSFVSTFALSEFKVVHLEEADYITPNGQAVLRRMMEEYADSARFIMTCNYEHKIIPAVKSRSQHFHFDKPEIQSVSERVAEILLKENVKFTLDELDKYVSVGYPDIRKILNLVQQHSPDERLLSPTNESVDGDYKFQLLDCLEQDDWAGARKIACANVSPEEWESVYRFLYENIRKSKKFSHQQHWDSAIVVIADYMYKHTLVADPEINAAAMFIQLSNIG